MSNTISRRNFLKFAGASVLAVSAAGMLSGCVGGIPVDVIFVEGKNEIAVTKAVATSPALKVAKLKVPTGYALNAKLRAEDATVPVSAENIVKVNVVKVEEFTVKYAGLTGEDKLEDKKVMLPNDVDQTELEDMLGAKMVSPLTTYNKGTITLADKTITITLTKKETAAS